MRIDRSDLADEPDRAHRGNSGGSDVPADSFPSRPDSALRIERSAAYRAAVDAGYWQYAIDLGHGRAEKPERETVAPAMRRIDAEVPERHLVGPDNRSNGRDRPTVAAELESFQVPDQRNRRPRAHRGSDRTVPQVVGHVRRERRRDAEAK